MKKTFAALLIFAVFAAAAQLITQNNGIRIGGYDGPLILTGAGSPVGAVVAPKGSIYLATNSGLGFYYKYANSDSSGWSAGNSSNFFRGDGVFANIVPIAPTNNGAYVLFVTNGVASWIAHP